MATEYQEVSPGVKIERGALERGSRILTPEAIDFFARIHREFNHPRLSLLKSRQRRQEEIDRGVLPGFLKETAAVREGNWKVAPTPPDLENRRVEITGPAEPKMMINALNSGAKVFMADLEDALSPTWENLMLAQESLMEAVRGTLSFQSPEGKTYRLSQDPATLLVRPRGWHLEEKHIFIDGARVSASLFDFSMYFFHNAQERVNRGTAPYFYLPKLESHLEARLWNDVFNFAQDMIGIRRGTVRATVLIETILAAFEMEEILYELKDHAAGLNAGRWDYIFSAIKKFRRHRDFVLPDRSQVTMTVPFMRAYTDLLVRSCHRHGAHAIGGMSAFIPSRKDPKVNEIAITKVREDKDRESRDGFDGTWVAHPDLVPIAASIFDSMLGKELHQKHRQRDEVVPDASRLLRIGMSQGTGGRITEQGFRSNIEIALQYLERWLSGLGAVAIHNLMEDAATAEISRAQLWQWIQHSAKLEDGRAASHDLYRKIRDEEIAKLGGHGKGRYAQAVEVLDALVMSPDFPEFLTTLAYERLEN